MEVRNIQSIFSVWGIVGLYYLVNIWWKPNTLMIGIGFTMGILIVELWNYLFAKQESENYQFVKEEAP